MSQSLYYKLIVVCLISFAIPKAINPDGSEQSIKLTIGKHKKVRKYHKIDNNLSYTVNNRTNDNLSFLIIARKRVPSKMKEANEFGYSISINNTSVSSNNYKKNADLSIYSDKYPGHSFTDSGEYLITLEPSPTPYKIEITPSQAKHNNKLFIRTISWDPIQEYKDGHKIYPINIQNTKTILRNNKSYDYYVLDPNEIIQYKVIGPRLITINSRIAIKKNNVEKRSYKLNVVLDGTEIGNFYYKFRSSGKSKIKGAPDYIPSMWDRNRIYVPPGTHFISISSNQKRDPVLLRAFEYKPK